MDPNDENPRAVIPLLDAKVSALPKEIRLRGYDMHYQIMIEPKYHEKSFRLASERGGSHGKDEIESWQTAFDIASKPADIAASLIKAAREKKKLMLDESDGVTDVGDASGRNDIHRVNDAASGANERTTAARAAATAVRHLRPLHRSLTRPGDEFDCVHPASAPPRDVIDIQDMVLP